MACRDKTCRICNLTEELEEKKEKKEQEKREVRPDEPVSFDEQLRLVDCDGQPASNVPYEISLDGGMKLSGTTDSDGRTERIVTSRPTNVMSITLTPPSFVCTASCCNTTDSDMAVERIYVKSETTAIATTNDTEVGASVVDVIVPEGKKRALTTGEISMARTVFGRGVDYSKVWVHHGGWWVFLGMQDENTAVTPNGEMYYPSALYQHDFSSSSIDPRWRALFMHEMAHVWPYQMGYSVKWHGLTVTSRGRSAYVYQLNADSRLCDFNMEQQGEIMSDYYMICVFGNSDMARNPGKSSALLRKVMESFIENPCDTSHLPG